MRAPSLSRRALAILTPVDAVSGRAIARPLSLAAPGARFARTRSGHVVLHDLRHPADPVLDQAWRAFANGGETAPPAVELAVELSDPDGGYLPRIVHLALPVDAAALATAIPLSCHPAPHLPPLAGEALVLLTVARPDGSPFAGALVELRIGGDLRTRSLSAPSGEALLRVSGLRAREAHADSGFIVPETEAELRIVADRRGPWPCDPDTLDATPALHRHQVDLSTTIAAGRLARTPTTIIPPAG